MSAILTGMGFGIGRELSEKIMSDNSSTTKAGTNIPNEVSSRGINEEYWCAIKHSLHLEGHLEENMANAARHDKQEVFNLSDMLNRVRQIRQELVKKVLGVTNSTSSSDDNCPRCSADLNIISNKLHKKNDNKDAYINTTYEIDNINRDNSHIHNIIKKEKGVISMKEEVMELAKLTGGQAAGALVYDAVGTSATLAPYRSYVTVGGGLLLALLPSYVKAGETLEYFGAVAGTHMAARELVSIVKSKVMPGVGTGGMRSKMATYAAAPMQMNTGRAGTGGAQVF